MKHEVEKDHIEMDASIQACSHTEEAWCKVLPHLRIFFFFIYNSPNRLENTLYHSILYVYKATTRTSD